MGNNTIPLSGSGADEIEDLCLAIPETISLHPCPDRQWIKIGKKDELCSDITLVTHNILAPRYAHKTKYPHCSSEYLSRKYRRRKLIQQLTHFQPLDIFCLQELQGDMLDELLPPFQSRYEHVFKRITKFNAWELLPQTDEDEEMKKVTDQYKQALFKQREGVGIFWKKDVFECLKKYDFEFNREAYRDITLRTGNSLTIREVVNDTCLSSHNVSCAVLLRHIVSQKKILVSTIHAFFNRQKWVGQTYQMETYLRKISEIEEEHDAMILCGDFNAFPDSKSIEFIKNGEIKDFPRLVEEKNEIPAQKERIYKILDREPKHKIKNLKECYPKEFKHLTQKSHRDGKPITIDYIFRHGGIKPIEILEIPKKDYLEKDIPNKNVFSDHLMLGVKLAFCETPKENEEVKDEEVEVEGEEESTASQEEEEEKKNEEKDESEEEDFENENIQ